jgi:hypothetical protein
MLGFLAPPSGAGVGLISGSASGQLQPEGVSSLRHRSASLTCVSGQRGVRPGLGHSSAPWLPQKPSITPRSTETDLRTH